MNTALAIARREFRTYFNSPIAYIVIGAFLLVAGWLFFGTLFLSGQASLRGFFGISPVLFVVFAPAVTMRLVAEERKTGTLELLLSMPVQDWEVVAGKFLAALGMVAVGLLWTLPYPLTVASLAANGASFDWGTAIAGYVGLLLMASSFLALGLWASTLSRNQIVGFIVGLILCLAFYLVDKFAVILPAGAAEILQFLSVDYHFDNIARGVFDSRDLLFYASLTAAGLLLTTRSLAAARR
jgi:ABC-2 type transport system permease protein